MTDGRAAAAFRKEILRRNMSKKEKINEKGVPYGAGEHMPLWYPLAWSTRGISAALNVIFIGYISFYASDVLGLAGYDGTLEVQSASANMAIGGMYNIFPLVCYAVMFVLAMFYKMDDVRPQMQADLAAKRAKNQ